MIVSTDWFKSYPHIACNASNYAPLAERDINYIVCHYTGNAKDTASANANYFKNNVVGTSAHFFVDETTIIQSVPLRHRAWHASSRTYNQGGIGIEMCCSGNYRISEATKKKCIGLIVELMNFLGWDANDVEKRILRHYDCDPNKKMCPYQMAGENNTEWAQFKADIKSALKGSDDVSEIKYKTTADVPDWAKEAVEFGVKYKVIADPNNLNLSDEGLRLLVMMFRMHTL